MPNLVPRTQLAKATYTRRRWLSFSLIILGVIGLLNALGEECIEFSRTGVVECKETEPFSYWSSFAALVSVIVGLALVFLSSFGKLGEAIHKQQEALLNNWLNDWGDTFKQPQAIHQKARMPGLAKFLLIITGIFLLFILVRFGAFRDLFRLFMFVLVLFPFGLGVMAFIQWLGESVKIDEQGISRYHILMGWQDWSWNEITAVKLEGDYFEKNYQIKIFKHHQRIIFTPATFHSDKQRFILACRWIIQQALLNQSQIHLPPDGLEEWLEAVQK